MNRPTITVPERYLAAQEAALATALFGSMDEAHMATLPPEVFDDERCRVLWEDLRTEHVASEARVSYVATHPLGGREFVAELHGRTLSHDPEEVRDRLQASHALHLATKTLSGGAGALGLTKSASGDVAQAIEEIQRSLSGVLAQVGSTSRPVNMRAGADAFIADALHPREEGEKVSFGLPGLDKMLSGGLLPTKLGVILANSGHGKSTLALQAAIRAADKGIPVLYVSREMKEEELFERVVSYRLRIKETEVKRRIREGDKEVLRRVKNAGDLSISIDSTLETMSQVEARVIQGTGLEYPFGLVVLDYLQLMRAPEIREKRQEIDYLINAAKSMAMRRDLVVLVPSQVRRATDMSAPPMLTDGRETSGIENACDVCISMLKEHGADNGDPEMRLAVRKNRKGPEHEVVGSYHMGAGTFRIFERESQTTVLS